MFWIVSDAPVMHRRRESDRGGIEVPPGNGLAELSRPLSRRHFRAGIKLSPISSGHHQLHVRTANVDHQDSFLSFHVLVGGGLIGASFRALGFLESARRLA